MQDFCFFFFDFQRKDLTVSCRCQNSFNARCVPVILLVHASLSGLRWLQCFSSPSECCCAASLVTLARTTDGKPSVVHCVCVCRFLSNRNICLLEEMCGSKRGRKCAKTDSILERKRRVLVFFPQLWGRRRLLLLLRRRRRPQAQVRTQRLIVVNQKKTRLSCPSCSEWKMRHADAHTLSTWKCQSCLDTVFSRDFSAKTK